MSILSMFLYAQVCPGLYRVEDAASSKAHELLLAAAQSSKPAERTRMIQEAVEIAKVSYCSAFKLGMSIVVV